MAVQTIAALKAAMPIGTAGGTSVQDIHDIVDTLEDRTTQTVLPKTASYTATSADNRCMITFNAASGVTLTLPNSLPVGWECGVVQLGAGAVTFSVASGGALLCRGGHTRTAGQYAQAYVVVVANAGTAAQVALGGDTAT
jgi:hypothetical protein